MKRLSQLNRLNRLNRIIRPAVCVFLTACVLMTAGCAERAQEPAEPSDTDLAGEVSAVLEEQTEALPEMPDDAAGEQELDEITSLEEPSILQNLNVDGSIFTRTFYQAGNVNNRVQFYARRGEDGDEYQSGRLGLFFTFQNPPLLADADNGQLAVNGDAEVQTVPGQNTYQTELAVRGYQGGEIVMENTCPVVFTLSSENDRCVFSIQLPEGSDGDLKEAEVFMGDYYSMPEEEEGLFNRYLCEAELYCYPSEDLRLMRNMIYAAHGRKFQDQVLSQYMESHSWYRGTVEPGDFSEEVLSDAEKKNIALLRDLEQKKQDDRTALKYEDYGIENFAFAPYLALLSENKETGLRAEMGDARDCGSYFCVPGELYLPVTLTRQQWMHVRYGGEEEELCVNELTGETKILEYDSMRGWLFYKKGAVPEDDGPSDIQIRYNYDTGCYELQEASDDTIMKMVYEGDLYILKGSVWGGMVSLMTASELQQEITSQTGTVYGNCLYHNGRGYFTAIYSLGD